MKLVCLGAVAAAACHAAPVHGWEWVEVGGAVCHDGTPTGFGVSRGKTKDVLVYFQGGGECFDADTCFVKETAVLGPFRERELAAESRRMRGPLDRADAANPFRDWNLVYIPYCTGDYHGGAQVASYGGRPFHHVGARNVGAALPKLTAMFPRPPRLAIVGVSAGGYGAVFNYAALRDAWAPGAAYLVDDSGPLLPGDAIAPERRRAMFSAWKLGELLDPVCGAACREDLSRLHAKLAERYPGDRLALLSSLRDHDIAATFHLDQERFQAALQALMRDVGGWRWFITSGDRHMMLDDPGRNVAGDKPLWRWLADDVANDAGWASVPP